ncbi:MAG TPA: hypothetical protein VL866_18985 [Pyrinomonadaceae bacterium]|nr:hypothetical protein [Pyrinomonadaceae bacterium]
MNRLAVCALSFVIVASISACSFKKSPASESTNQSAQSENKNAPAKSQTTQPQVQAGELQPGQASGTYTAKGETVELKYAYAGRAERFSEEAIVILLTDKPIPPEAVAAELKDTSLLDGDKIRGLEYAIMKDGMWVRFHPSQYQESGTMKIKDYKVENDVVSGTDETDGGLSDERYARSVKFVATILK